MNMKKILYAGSEVMPFAATGGLGEIIAREAKCIDYSDRILTLEGLRLLYELNN